jgi:hypothetical protein
MHTVRIAPVGDRQDRNDPSLIIDAVQRTVVTTTGG